MARIAGVNIPQNKVVNVALTYIHGIGKKFSNDICTKLNIPKSKRVNSLTDDEVLKIREFIDSNYKVEGDLRREVQGNIRRLIDIGAYRGLRHRRGLPSRAQQTRTNSRTRRAGSRRAIAGRGRTIKK